MGAGTRAKCFRLSSVTHTELDPRIHAFDETTQQAEEALRGRLTGEWHFITPKPFGCGKTRLSLRAGPEEQAAQVSEALPGEAMALLWEQGDWARVRTTHDRYLGWVKKSEIENQLALKVPGDNTTALTVTALRAHAFAGPKVSQPITAQLCLGCQVWRGNGEVVEENGRRWVPVILPDQTAAYVQEVCFSPLAEPEMTALALRFLETPYVWGGRSAWGLDCSGLTQVVYQAFGHAIPRDADQQQEFLPAVTSPQAGDLAFFPGHVGIMLDQQRLIHANATHMRVTIETFGVGDYGKRLAGSFTGFGRLA